MSPVGTATLVTFYPRHVYLQRAEMSPMSCRRGCQILSLIKGGTHLPLYYKNLRIMGHVCFKWNQ